MHRVVDDDMESPYKIIVTKISVNGGFHEIVDNEKVLTFRGKIYL